MTGQDTKYYQKVNISFVSEIQVRSSSSRGLLYPGEGGGGTLLGPPPRYQSQATMAQECQRLNKDIQRFLNIQCTIIDSHQNGTSLSADVLRVR